MSASSALILIVFAVVAAILAVRWQRTLVLGMPFLVILNGVPLALGGSTVRVDQLAACGLALPLVAAILARRRAFRGDAITWLLGLILALNVCASLINSPARAYSLLQCANVASAWLLYVIVVNFVDSPDELHVLLRRSLQAACAVSAIAIVAFALSMAGLSVGGADVSRAAAQDLTRPFGAYATMVEPNILGSYCAAHLILGVGLLETKHARLCRWAVPLCAVALLLSFTRSAWIGAVAGVLVWIVLTGRGRTTRVLPIVAALGAIAGAAAVVAMVPGPASEFLRAKLANLFNLNSPTAALRLLTYGLALEQTAAHPIMGWGTFTFAPLVAQGTDFAQYAGWRSIWITNFLLLALHDTGIIGLILWVALIALLLVRGVRATRAIHGVDAAYAAALTAAFATLLVPFLATTGFSLGYPWLMAGLLGAHLRLREHPVS